MAHGTYDKGTTSVRYIRPRLEWNSTANMEANASIVTVTLWAQNTASGTGWVDGVGTWQIFIDGACSGNLSQYVRVQAGQGWTEIASWTKTVSHDADGTKSIKIQAIGGISSASVWHSTTAGVVIELDRIVKGASEAYCTPSVDVNGINRSTVMITPAAPNLYHRVTWRFGGFSHAQSGTETSMSYALPTTWLGALPSAVSGTAHVDLETFSDSDLSAKIGSTQTCDFTITVPASFVPTWNDGWAEISPDNAGTSVKGNVYVAGHSRAKVHFDPTKVTASAGTSIQSYWIEYAGRTYDSPYVTPVLLAAGENSVRAWVRDQRGRTASQALPFRVLSYTGPSLTDVQVYRCSASGEPSDSDAYASVKATANVSDLDGANQWTLGAQIKPVGGDYGESKAMRSGEALLLGGLEAQTSYMVRILLSDSMGAATSHEALLAASSTGGGDAPSLRGFHIRDGGLGAAFGMQAEEDGWLSVHYAHGLRLTEGRKLRIGNTELSEAQLIALLNLL